MMKTLRSVALRFSGPALLLFGATLASAQAVNTAQQITFAGLRSNAGHGSFPASAYAPDGSLLVLYDQGDGVRVLKLNAAGNAVLAQAQLGAAGDVPVALALDPSGNVYVTGTTASASLSGTPGTAFPGRADTSTNSFLARLNPDLSIAFISFLGAGRTAATSVAATADAVFVTGLTYSASLPVTSTAIQQQPASGSSQNGFVERFTPTGALVYATYLTGGNGNTAPAAIAADASDDAYITGSTTSTGFPTIAALVPEALGESSGFLTKLTPAGDGIVFSTFIPGTGLTGLALDGSSSTLLLTGNVSPGQFPLTNVSAPIANTAYQTLVRIPVDGQSVSSSTLLVPGSQSFVAVAAPLSAWVSGTLSAPLFPGTSQPLALLGDGFALHVTANNTIDQTIRFGAASPTVATNPFTVSPGQLTATTDGSSVAIPSTLSANVSASTAATQAFDVPLVNAPNSALPNSLRDAATSCTTGQCFVTSGYLVGASSASNAPSLSLSVDHSPTILLRNLGSASATDLAITANGFSVATDCSSTLLPSNLCTIALTGAGPGNLNVSAANAPAQSIHIAAVTSSADVLALSPVELDFGLLAAASGAAARTITVTNLSATTQTFSSAQDTLAKILPYTLAEVSSDCAVSNGIKTLTAGASCHITVGLSASSNAANDGIVRTAWKIGARDVAITALTQAASLTVSAAEVDFGTQYIGGLRTARQLYLSNAGPIAIAHASVALPSSSPFAVADGCPSFMEAHSVCRLTLSYSNPTAPASDAVTLTLDQGLSVLVTGKTLPQQGVTSSTANPSLVVSPTNVSFSSPVVVTGISTSTQAVVLKNTGASSLPLAISLAGDFTATNGCPAILTAGSSCQLLISFTPSQPGPRDGLLSVTGGSGFAPAYVSLSGTAAALLPANNGVLDLGQTRVGEPIVAWYRIQQSVTSLSISSTSPSFSVALVADTGYGHGNPPPTSFTQNATGACGNCWLGIQFLAQTPGTEVATLTLSTVTGGKPYTLALTGTALSVTGLYLSPLSQDFGPIAINSSSAPQAFTLANLLTPAQAASITSVAASGDFTVAAATTGAAACAGSLATSASCLVEVFFAPTAEGTRAGTLTIVTSAGTVSSSLSGFGLPDPGFALNPVELDFNDVPGSAATQQSITVSNTSTMPLIVGPLSSSDPAFQITSACAILAPGATCSVAVTFLPGTAPVSAILTIPATATINGQTITTNVTATLRGLYTSEEAGLQIVPAAVNYGTTPVGTLGLTRQFTLNNLTSKSLSVAFALPRQFLLTTPTACATLAANAGCSFSVVFAPAEAAEATGTILVQATQSDGSAPLQSLAYMQGYGSSSSSLQITGNPIPNAPLNFGSVTSGQSAVQVLTITNTSGVPVNVRRVISEPPFLSMTTCAGPLSANATCTITLTYAPINEVASGAATTVARADQGTLIVESDAASSPDVVHLTAFAQPVNAAAPASNAALATFSLSNSALTFAATAVGNQTAPQTVAITNTGNTTIHILGLQSSADFTAATTCTVLLPGDACSISVSFTPSIASSATDRAGTLEIRTDATNSLEYISLLGSSTASPLTVSPAALDFGAVNVGSASSPLAVTVANTTSAPITLASFTTSGDYTVASGSCPAASGALAASSSCTLQITFHPTATGTRNGTLSIATSATALPLTVSLIGNAMLAHLQATPGALAYGAIATGAPAQLSFTLLNTGTAAVTSITSTISGADAADFAVTTPCSSSSLAPNQGCSVTVTFTPSATGARTAVLNIASSDPSSPLTIPLTGSGAASGTFTLAVNNASTASASVASGTPATYTLTLTPVNGYTGTVALTCAAVTAAPYATCSISPSQVALSGAGSQNSTVTINTITSVASNGVSPRDLIAFCALIPLLLSRRLKQARHRLTLVALAVLTVLAANFITGCGGSSPAAPGNKYLLTPSGTYQYQVTASSTTGTAISQTVTLNLSVQ